MSIGIMSAMPEEIESLIGDMRDVERHEHGMRTYHVGKLWGRDVTLVFSRWGKVAAATTATNLIARFGAKELLFTGVAGGVKHGLKVGDVVVAEDLVQHDMNAEPIFPRHVIPLLGVAAFRADPERSRRLLAAAQDFLESIKAEVAPEKLTEFGVKTPSARLGEVASGDKFFASKAALDELRRQLPNVMCVEMEGAAVAQVCHEHGVPFAVLRTISDGADDTAHIDFQAFVRSVATHYAHGILKRYMGG